MGTCELYNDLFLDYLYGLLEEDQAANLRGHLDACPGCQAALQEAQGQQKLFGRAAQVCAAIPEFVAPDFDQTPLQLAPVQTAPAPVAQSQPINTSVSSRSRWLRIIPFALAASVLVAVGLGYRNYQQELSLRQATLAQARQEVAQIDAQFALAQSRFEKEKQTLPVQLAKEPLHVQMSGPAQYHPEVSGPLHIETRDVNGEPQTASLQVQCIDQASGKTLLQKEIVSKGNVDIQLPAGLEVEGNQLLLDVQARTPNASVQLQEELTKAPAMHVTHLALNKTSYHIGELLFFRTLTLEHFSHKPPDSALHLRFALTNLEGKTVKHLEGVTGPGGIGGGEFALTNDIPTGIYFLEAKAQGTNNVLPQKRRVEIVRASTPQIEFDRNQYNPGDQATFTLRNRDVQNSVPLPDQTIIVQPLNPPGPTAAKAQPMPTRTDNKGRGSYQIPKELETSRPVYEYQFPGAKGKSNEKVVQALRVLPTKLAIDFFPEGGELVEGVPTRVYYRVRSLQGDPVDPEGRVIVLSSSEVLHDSEPGKGLGVFSFVPRKNEKYTVRITAPQAEFLNPFQQLGVQPHGLVLGVPSGVTRADEPMALVLGYKGDSKRLLILATCRGQVVEQKSLVIQEGQTNLQLKPAPEAAGILRVTVYEARAGEMVPLAERLVFRTPVRGLDLTAATNQGKLGTVPAGQPANLKIEGKNEQQKLDNFWGLAIVVNDKVSTHQEPGLQTHYFLTSDIRTGEELEESHLLLRENPESRQALDLFLGTQGWRKFVPESDPLVLAQAKKETARADKAGQAGKDYQAQLPGFFSQENASVAQLQEQHQSRLAKTLSALQADLARQREALGKEKEARVENYNRLAIELADYQDLLQRTFLVALGWTVLLGVLVSGLLLLVGLVRMLQRKSATFAFGGAFACLGVVLVVYLSSAPGDEKNSAMLTQMDVRPLPPVPEVPLADVGRADGKKEKTDLPTGQFALATPRPESAATVVPEVRANNLDDGIPLAKKADNDAYAGGGYGNKGEIKLASNDKKALAPELEQRFKDAKKAQEQSAAGGPSPAPPGLKPQQSVPPQQLGQSKNLLSRNSPAELNRETQVYAENGLRPYGYRRGGQTAEPLDTVLWHPALFAENGTLELSFDLPNQPATYRVLIFGNTPEGRLGFFEGKLEATSTSRK